MLAFIATMFKVGFFLLQVVTFVPGLVLKLVFGSKRKHAAHKAHGRMYTEKKGKCCSGFIGKFLFFFAICAIISVIATKLIKRFHGKDDWEDDDWDDYDEDDADASCKEGECCPDEECTDESCCPDECTDGGMFHHHKGKKKSKVCNQVGLINILCCRKKKR